MPWFRVDDSFHSHPKVMATSPAALGLWVVAGSWSSAHLTDGVVPDHVLPLLVTDGPQLAKELAAKGLWKRQRGAYRFHDWRDRNPTAAEVQHQRKVRADAGRKGGLASGKARSKPQAKREANASGLLEPPARPGPVPSSADADEAARPLTDTQRSKRITDAYAETEPMCRWPAVNGVVLKAIRSRRYQDAEILDALLRLAKEGRSVTVETLRIELDGMTPRKSRQQADTDALFARAMRRAEARESHDPPGNSHPDQVRQSVLPPAGDR